MVLTWSALYSAVCSTGQAQNTVSLEWFWMIRVSGTFSVLSPFHFLHSLLGAVLLPHFTDEKTAVAMVVVLAATVTLDRMSLTPGSPPGFLRLLYVCSICVLRPPLCLPLTPSA